MASETFPKITVNKLREITFIAGSYKELYFNLYTSASSVIDVTYATGYWTLCPYNQPNYVALYKYGVCYNGYFVVYLYSSDTENLSGKYIQKPMLINVPKYEYRLASGIINIIPAIGGI